MGGQTSVWGQSVFDPLGAAIERKTFGKGREDAKNRKKIVRKPNQADANRAELFQMMKDRQANITKQLQGMQTSQQSQLQNQQAAQQDMQPVAQIEQPVGQVDQNATNAILNPAPTVTPTTTSSVAAPTVISPNAPLANEYTGMAQQQKTNKFAMPSTSGLRFGGT
jgi:hypothetical protein